MGRLQKLKGTKYLEEIVTALPNLKFAVVCPPTETSFSSFKNITFIDGTKINKSEIYSLSNLVIVPSIFETSSMVAIEALTYGCRVVLWEHLGGLGYFTSLPELITITPNDTDGFVKAIVANDPPPKSTDNKDTTSTINNTFNT